MSCIGCTERDEKIIGLAKERSVLSRTLNALAIGDTAEQANVLLSEKIAELERDYSTALSTLRAFASYGYVDPHAISSRLATLEREKQSAEEEIKRLREWVYVPGEMKCAKCGFVCHKMILCATTGRVGVDTRETTEPCPNGCGPLWRRSYKEADDEAGKRMVALFDETVILRDQIKNLADYEEAYRVAEAQLAAHEALIESALAEVARAGK